MKRLGMLFLMLAVFTLVACLAHARRLGMPPQRVSVSPSPEPLPSEMFSTVPLVQAAADTFHLAWFSFENAGGAADEQGWTSVDLTAQIDTFWHVAGGTELDGGDFGALIALEGAQSMWCGVDATSDPPFCGYAALPGYGNSWHQILISKVFDCDSLRLSYKVFWDSEPGYDRTWVEYLDPVSSDWNTFPVQGHGASLQGCDFIVRLF